MKINIEILKSSDASTNPHTYICKIGLSNKLDHSNALHLENALLFMIQGGMKKLMLDLTDLKYIDSTGIGKLIKITKTLRKTKGDVCITKCTSHIVEIFKLVRLEKFIKIFNSNEEGLNFLTFI